MELAIDTYRAANAVTYQTPPRRFFFQKARRLLRLAERVHTGKLFIPEIVGSLREAADELAALGNILLLTDKGYGILTGLRWIKSAEFAPEDLNWEVHEKTRHHVTKEDRVQCGLCGVPLVYPAQIVWRRGLKVIDRSRDIGIYCLTREAARNGWGKLEDLITDVRAVRQTVEAKYVAASQPAQQLLPDPKPGEPSAPRRAGTSCLYPIITLPGPRAACCQQLTLF